MLGLVRCSNRFCSLIVILVLISIISAPGVEAAQSTLINRNDSGKEIDKVEAASAAALVLPFLAAAAVGGTIEGVAYAIDCKVFGREWDWNDFAGHVTSGALIGMAHLALALFPNPVLATVVGATDVPGVAGAFGDILGNFFEICVTEISSVWDAIFSNIESQIESNSAEFSGRFLPTLEALCAEAGYDPDAPFDPIWVDFESENIQTSGLLVETIGMEYNSEVETSWRMLNPGSSMLRFSFALASVPDGAIISLTHLSSAADGAPGGGYSPVDIYINGFLFRDNYDVAENNGGSHGYEIDQWEISNYLIAGQNSIDIEFEDDPWAYTHYWIQSMVLYPGIVVGQDYVGPIVLGERYSTSKDTNIYVAFDEILNETTLNNNTIHVFGSVSGTNTCIFSFDWSEKELTINPDSDFEYGETATVTVGTGVQDLAGNGLVNPYAFSFQISSPYTYTIIPSAGSHGSIFPDVPMAVLPGHDQSFMAIDLDAGYEVDKWYLDGNPAQTGGNTYTVFNVQSKHLVLVTFKLSGGNPSEITVTSPNGGETYGQRNRMRINWDSTNIEGNIKIDLYKGGSLNLVIEESYYNSGSYSWPIPNAQPIDSDYRIRITSVVTPAIWDESDGNFSITEYIPRPDRIEISTLNQLRAVSENLGTPSYPRNGYYVLMNDIDASDTDSWDDGFEPIGMGTDYFIGTFDGQGYTITDLKIDRYDQREIGLFSVLGEGAVIKNLTLAGGRINGRGTFGALVGESDGTIINCHSSMEVRGADTDAKSEVGGLVGYNHIHGRIMNCSTYHQPGVDSQVRAYDVDDVGGIAGSNAGIIEWCSSTLQSVKSDGDKVGGIAGTNHGTIRECSSISIYVYGNSYIGGVVGYNSGTVSDCYSAKRVEGIVADKVGGVVGQNNGGTIERSHVFGRVQSGGGGLVGRYYGVLIADSFWDINTTAIPATTPCGGGCAVTNCYGKTTAEMMQRTTFEDIGGWDFNNVWCIAEGVSYPNLRGVGNLLPQPTGLNASTGLRTGVHLSWNSVMYEIDGVSYEAAYRVYVSDSDAADAPKTQLSDWQSGSAYIDATAIPNVTYYYWIKAAATIGGARESDFSASAAGSRDYPPMDTPTNVTATDGLPDLVLIQWDPVLSASHYRVYRAASEGGVKTALGSWQTDSSFPDTPPTGSTAYYYWATAAIDALGERESDFGGPDTGWFYISEQTPPSVSVTSSPELPIETQDVSLSVSASDNDVLDRIVLHWNDGSDHEQAWEDIDSATFDDSHSIGSFSSGQEIMHWAEAWDRSGNRAESEYQMLVIQPEEVVSPERPSGEAFLQTGEVGTYSTAGSSTNLDHPVEYQFDWDDGQQSAWVSATSSHSWSSEGFYFVKAQARCQTHTNRESGLSTLLMVTVDSTDPLVEITTNGGNGPGEDFITWRQEVVLEGVASDTEPSSGLDTVSIDTGDPNEGSLSNWRFTVDLAEGPNTFVVSVSDNAGNIGTDSIVITLDTNLDGKMFDLITTPTTSVNAISLCLEGTGLLTADDLGAAIMGCDLVSKWDADTQSYYSHVPGVPDGRNFDLIVGEAYFVSVTENSAFELIGLVPDSLSFNLITTATTNVNAISLPYGTTITTADELGADIPGCDLVSKWDATTQSYYSHVPGVPDGRNFDVFPGEAYFVSVTGDVVWP